jgi:hypothetical protein
MWSTRCVQLAHGCLISVDLENRPVKFSDVLRSWQDDPDFRAFFIGLLADAPFSAFRWETPPITAASAGRPFEFVLLDSPELDAQPDSDAFAEHFGGAAGSQDVVSFPNLNHDAILVVPRPRGPSLAYGHIAAFVREAPEHAEACSVEAGGRTDATATGAETGLAQHGRSGRAMASREAGSKTEILRTCSVSREHS